jgi:hypothetical protein
VVTGVLDKLNLSAMSASPSVTTFTFQTAAYSVYSPSTNINNIFNHRQAGQRHRLVSAGVVCGNPGLLGSLPRCEEEHDRKFENKGKATPKMGRLESLTALALVSDFVIPKESSKRLYMGASWVLRPCLPSAFDPVPPVSKLTNSQGRGHYEEEVIVNPEAEASSGPNPQQYNDRGYPRNPETKRQEREHVRAANEVMQVTGVVEDSLAAKVKASQFMNEKNQETLTGLRFMEGGRAVLVGGVWGVLGLRRRILVTQLSVCHDEC